VILACNAYLDDLVALISSKIMPINNYMITTEPIDEDMG